ncbi:hypothetical protein EIKCOROL_00049 [Eikenella corrodens ATCC 23834]|uniref:Uncharacterized protein n=1 Tax=Eikenella corrodens ATCC 23834 TaxID=546274 RepID=C0DRT3_EIKCO|nr:hypothetical protein EIKCOROL_00049 [Eikenella corrodens ATCC 23834]
MCWVTPVANPTYFYCAETSFSGSLMPQRSRAAERGCNNIKAT